MTVSQRIDGDRSVRPFQEGLSVWLDLVRLMAAILVLLAHTRAVLLPQLPLILTMHAPEAVAVFFVLSGFVIRYVTVTRHVSLGTYLLDRSTRIYSVAIPAILVTILADRLGQSLNPEFYTGSHLPDGGITWDGLLRYLTFTNETWGIHDIFGTLEPYWSLGYEVPYYLAFGIVFFGRMSSKFIIFACWAAIFGPYVVAYGSLWFLGVWLYDTIDGTGWASALLNRAPAIALLLAPLLYPFIRMSAELTFGSWFRPTGLPYDLFQWAYFNAIGILFALHLVGFSKVVQQNRPPASTSKIVRWAAGSTFTIYLMHLPILILFGALSQRIGAGVVLNIAFLCLTVILLVLLSYVGERQKGAWRSAIQRAFGLGGPGR